MVINLKIVAQEETVDSESALYGNDDSGLDYNPEPVKKKQKQKKLDDDSDCKVIHEKDLKKKSLKSVPNVVGINGKEIPFNPVVLSIDSMNKKDPIIISEDIDWEILIKLNEDRIKGNSLMNEVKLSSINDRIVHITCYGFDKDISETCVDRFSRIYTCKSSIIDNVLIEKGIGILQTIVDYSGFSKYMNLLLDIKDIVKLNQSIDFDMKAITGGNANNSKTFNVSEVTKTKVRNIAYMTGVSDSSIAYVCCLLSLSFSNNTINNVKWFKEDYIDGKNNFIKTKVLRWFLNQKGVLKNILSKSIKSLYDKYINTSYIVRKVGFDKSNRDDIISIINLYKLFRDLKRMNMIESYMYNQLNDDRAFINEAKNFIKLKEEVASNEEKTKKYEV